ncbi:MAG: heme ABC transporter permease CcmB [candidate division Zixibacteria bacterium]|nr:heme ABC transporter permease CcmB [candidate division Zixibacteria bacterium]
MEQKSSGLMAMASAILLKDIKSEFRTRYAFNALIMFALVILVVISIAIGQYNLSDSLASSILWILIFFASVTGLGQSFIKEEETGTVNALRLYSKPTAVWLGKLIFNTLLLLLLELIFVPLFFILLKVDCGNPFLFLTVIILSSIGLSGATTIIAAIIAKASVKGALFAVLSFPLLLPVLISAIRGTQIAFSGGSFGDAYSDIKLLISFPVIIMTVSVFLFDFIWNS